MRLIHRLFCATATAIVAVVCLSAQQIPGGGTTAPGGATTQVQYNNAGKFGGNANFLYRAAYDELHMGMGNTMSPGTGVISIDANKANGDVGNGMAIVLTDNADQDYPTAATMRVFATSQNGQNQGDVVGLYLYASWATPLTGTLDNLIGTDIYTVVSGAGAPTNNIGVRVGNVAGGTNNYAIYTGTGSVRFGGPILTAGTGMVVANVGANSCGTTAATIAGGANAFVITVGAGAGTQCRVTFPVTAATEWDCTSNDDTTTVAVRTTPVDTTHTDFIGTFTAADKVTGLCFAR